MSLKCNFNFILRYCQLYRFELWRKQYFLIKSLGFFFQIMENDNCIKIKILKVEQTFVISHKKILQIVRSFKSPYKYSWILICFHHNSLTPVEESTFNCISITSNKSKMINYILLGLLLYSGFVSKSTILWSFDQN